MLNNIINKASLQDRLLANINIVNDCWIWHGYVCHGHACIYVDGKMTLVRRINQQLFKKSILEGNIIGNICGQSLCVNPDHFKFKTQDCRIEGCIDIHYAKGYCRNHYVYFSCSPTYRTRVKSCQVENCSKPIRSNRQYCTHHHRQRERCLSKGIPYDPSMRQKGFRNGRWNGGVSEYPNHHAMKQMRKLKIEQCNGSCEVCGDIGKHIHHRDKNKANHSIDNLMLLCVKCHCSMHVNERRNNEGAVAG